MVWDPKERGLGTDFKLETIREQLRSCSPAYVVSLAQIKIQSINQSINKVRDYQIITRWCFLGQISCLDFIPSANEQDS